VPRSSPNRWLRFRGDAYYEDQSERHENLSEVLGTHKAYDAIFAPETRSLCLDGGRGTVELVRSVGPKIFTSADLVQKYEACWTAEQLQSHSKPVRSWIEIIREAFQLRPRGA